MMMKKVKILSDESYKKDKLNEFFTWISTKNLLNLLIIFLGGVLCQAIRSGVR